MKHCKSASPTVSAGCIPMSERPDGAPDLRATRIGFRAMLTAGEITREDFERAIATLDLAVEARAHFKAGDIVRVVQGYPPIRDAVGWVRSITRSGLVAVTVPMPYAVPADWLALEDEKMLTDRSPPK